MSELMAFLNLPTSNVERARPFYVAIGGAINPNFSDDKAICVVLSPTMYIMVVHRDYLQTFTSRPIAAPHAAVGAMLALSVGSRDDVDAKIATGVGSGGTEPTGSTRDLGFMYSRQVEDPDGNVLEFFWMDPAAATSGPPAE